MKKQRKTRLQLNRETLRSLGSDVSGGTGHVTLTTVTIALCETVTICGTRTITVCPSVNVDCGSVTICFQQEK